MATQATISSECEVTFGPFRFLPGQRLLLRAETPVRLGSRAREILFFLVEQAGSVVRKYELLKRVWPDSIVEEGTLRVHVAALRKALDDGKRGMRYVENVTGHGYRFVAPITRLAHSTSDTPVQAQPNAPLPQLPAPPARLIGRAQVITALAGRLEQRRLMTVAGPGGIGKTTVATATAGELRSVYQHGVCFVDLGSVHAPALVAGTVAAALGMVNIAADPLPDIVQFLKNSHMLVVLDNCEHVVEAAAILAEALITGTSGVHILATSREPLRAKDESVLRLTPLEIPPPQTTLTAVQALGFSAIQLFVERATALTHLFELQDCDVPLVVAICRKLDGLPLAIELAAARVDAFAPRELAAMLDDCLGFLTRGHRTALPRHRTLRATLDWSYAILPRAEQIALCRLSVFAGSFDVAAARAVIVDADSGDTAEVVNLLTDLGAKSLLTVRLVDDQAVYQLLATSRAYAIEKLNSSSECAAIRRRHARLCCSWGTQSTPDGASGDLRDSINRRIDDIRAALDWCFSDDGATAIGIELVASSAQLWFDLSFLNEYRKYLELALAAAARQPTSDALLVQLNAALGDALVGTQGSGEAVTAAFERTLTLATRLGAVSYHRRALWGLWVDRIIASDYRPAVDLAQRFQALTDSSRDATDAMTFNRMMALAQHLSGNQSLARKHVGDMLRGAEQPFPPPQPRALQFDYRVSAQAVLGRLLWIQGLPQQAAAAARDGIDCAASLGHVPSLCCALTLGTTVALWSGDLQEAGRLVRLLLDCAQRHALGYWQTWGRCLELAVKPRTDEVGLCSPLERFREDPFCSSLHLETLGTLKDELATAVAFRRAQNGQAGWCAAELLRVKARRLLAEEPADTAAAERLLQQSLETARQQGALSWELRSSITLARLWKARGRREQAHELLRVILTKFTEGLATRDLIRATTLLHEVALEESRRRRSSAPRLQPACGAAAGSPSL